MTFSEYINGLPNLKKQAIENIAAECCVTVITVYRWISGEIVPDALKRKTIARLLSKDEKELFPNV